MKIIQRGPDTFLLVWELGTGPLGKRRQRTETFHSGLLDGTPEERRKAAEDRWTVVRSEIIRGLGLVPDRMTMQDLCERWYRDAFMLRSPAVLTQRLYRDTLDLHLIPVLGHIRVQKLTPQDVQAAIAGLRRKDGRPGEPSPRQRQIALALLRQILRYAVKWQIVPRNVADLVDTPRSRPKEIPFWRQDEIEAFLAAAAGHRLYALFALALASGMRQGELIGLLRDDVDWRARTVLVRRAFVPLRGKMVETTPKTRRGYRTIALGPATMDMLAAHAERTAKESTERPGRRDQGLLFPSGVGTPLGSRNLLRAFDSIQERAKMRRIPFHGLRHTHATQLLAAGVPPHVVSQRLGHASVAFTLSVYAHVLPHQQAMAAEVMYFGERGTARGNMPPHGDRR